MRSNYLLLATLALSAFLAGCTKSTEKAVDSNPAAGVGTEKPGLEGLAELTPAERAVALEQKVCPVSGELLGSMGKPVKVSLDGKEVFLCCQSCEGQAMADPAATLAKLPK